MNQFHYDRAWRQLRDFVLERDNGICWLCHEAGANSADHVQPLSRGGLNTADNLRAAHQSCNSGKRDRVSGRVRRRPEPHPGNVR